MMKFKNEESLSFPPEGIREIKYHADVIAGRQIGQMGQ